MFAEFTADGALFREAFFANIARIKPLMKFSLPIFHPTLAVVCGAECATVGAIITSSAAHNKSNVIPQAISQNARCSAAPRRHQMYVDFRFAQRARRYNSLITPRERESKREATTAATGDGV
jgi:hypothetical protein